MSCCDSYDEPAHFLVIGTDSINYGITAGLKLFIVMLQTQCTK